MLSLSLSLKSGMIALLNHGYLGKLEDRWSCITWCLWSDNRIQLPLLSMCFTRGRHAKFTSSSSGKILSWNQDFAIEYPAVVISILTADLLTHGIIDDAMHIVTARNHLWLLTCFSRPQYTARVWSQLGIIRYSIPNISSSRTENKETMMNNDLLSSSCCQIN